MSNTIQVRAICFIWKQKTNQRIDRNGLTLIELLAVISIIGILASMVLVAMRGAQQDVLASKTRTTIAKIHEVIAYKYESYLTKSMPLKIPTAAFERTNGVRALSSREMSRIRLLAIRDLMRLEMPDRPGDVKFFGNQEGDRVVRMPDYVDFARAEDYPPLYYQGTGSASTSPELVPAQITCRLYEGLPQEQPFNLGRIPPPAGFVEIYRALVEAQAALDANAFIKYDRRMYWEKNNSNAELLFLIVSQSNIDNGSALELFGSNEIGDTDDDGLREFIDAWGTPIAWIRWPAGLDNGSGIFQTVEPFAPGGETSLDPLDPLLSDLGYEIGPNFRPGKGLFPLVVSAGPDKKFGLIFSYFSDKYSPYSDLNQASAPPLTTALQSAQFSPCDNLIGSVNSISLPSGYFDPLAFPDPYYPRLLNPDPTSSKTYILQPGENAFLRLDVIGRVMDIPKDFSEDNISNLEEFGASL